MSSLVNNALQNTADVVTLNQVRPPAVKNETPTGNEIPRSSGKPITLPEDVVTLSSVIPDEGAAPTPKKPSVAVSLDEKQALLNSDFSRKNFSIYA